MNAEPESVDTRLLYVVTKPEDEDLAMFLQSVQRHT